MAWTDGSDKSSGDVITAAIWNSYLGGLYSSDGSTLTRQAQGMV
jgi:hypothetical protein